MGSGAAAAAPEPEKMFKCPTCGRVFNKKANLKVHSRKHTGEKPYSCSKPGCGRSFMWKSSVTFHEQNCPSGKKSGSNTPVHVADASKGVQKRPKARATADSAISSAVTKPYPSKTTPKNTPNRPKQSNRSTDSQSNPIRDEPGTPLTPEEAVSRDPKLIRDDISLSASIPTAVLPPTNRYLSSESLPVNFSTSPPMSQNVNMAFASSPSQNVAFQTQPSQTHPGTTSQSHILPTSSSQPLQHFSTQSPQSRHHFPTSSQQTHQHFPSSSPLPLPTISPLPPDFPGQALQSHAFSSTPQSMSFVTSASQSQGYAPPASQPQSFAATSAQQPQGMATSSSNQSQGFSVSTSQPQAFPTSSATPSQQLFGAPSTPGVPPQTPQSNSPTDGHQLPAPSTLLAEKRSGGRPPIIPGTLPKHYLSMQGREKEGTNSTKPPFDLRVPASPKPLASSNKPPVKFGNTKMPKIPIEMELSESDDETPTKSVGTQDAFSFARTGNILGGFAPPTRCSPLPVSSPIVCPWISPMPLSPLAPFSPLPPDSPAHNAPNPVHPPLNQPTIRPTNPNW